VKEEKGGYSRKARGLLKPEQRKGKRAASQGKMGVSGRVTDERGKVIGGESSRVPL